MEFGVLRQYFWEKTEGKTKFGEKRKKGRDGGLKNIDKLNNLMGTFDTFRIASRIAKQI